MYNTTVKMIEENFLLEGFSEPRIEPEVIFKMRTVPSSEMNLEELLDCISHVSHGFEIVQSIFKSWQFTTVDTIVAFGLHGALLRGPFYKVSKFNIDRWLKELSNFEITLLRNDVLVEKGKASNILGLGSLQALKYILIGEERLGRNVEVKP